MNWLIIAVCTAILIMLIIIQKLMKSPHPIRSALIAVIWGIVALAAVNLCSSFTDVSIPVNPLTLSVSSVLGIPGVTCLLLLQRIL